MPINERKAAEMAVFFLLKTREGRMSHLKLMKLLYLSDRESFRTRGFSISNDLMVSMKHGPVLSKTLNLINGYEQSAPDGWNSLISAREDHQVSCNAGLKVEDLKKLSEKELDILESVWNKFGRMDQWEIRDYTHDNCPEWQDPGDSSFPIELDAMSKQPPFPKSS